MARVAPAGTRPRTAWEWEAVGVSEAHMIDILGSQHDRLARHLDWERSMQAAVARALDEHRGHGDAVVVMRDGKLVSLVPGQY